MKKKILTVCLLVLTVVLLLSALTACSQNNVKFVESSFEVTDIRYYESIHTVTAYFEYETTSATDCSFDIEYEIDLKNASTGETVYTKEYKKYGVKIKKGETKSFREYMSIDDHECSVALVDSIMDNAKLEIKNVKISANTSSSANEQYDGYAIGFGIVSALLLAGLITLFVISKKQDR